MANKVDTLCTPHLSPVQNGPIVYCSEKSHLDNMPPVEVNQLPDDVLLHIFRFLPMEDLVAIHEVCCRWRDLSKTRSLWKKASYYRFNEDVELIELLESAPYLHYLCLNFPYEWTEYDESYQRTTKDLSKELVATILKFRPEIGHLLISYKKKSFEEDDVSSILNSLANNLEHLEVELYQSMFFPDYDDYEEDDEKPRPPKRPDPKRTTGSFPNLKSLSLKNDYYYWHPKGENIPDWPKLEDLSLGNRLAHIVQKENIDEYFPAAVRMQIKRLYVEMPNLHFLKDFDGCLFPNLEELLLNCLPLSQSFCDNVINWESGTLWVNVAYVHHHSDNQSTFCCDIQRIVESTIKKGLEDLRIIFSFFTLECVNHVAKTYPDLKKLVITTECGKWRRHADKSAYHLPLEHFCDLLSFFPKLECFQIEVGHMDICDHENILPVLRSRFPNVKFKYQARCYCDEKDNVSEEGDIILHFSEFLQSLDQLGVLGMGGGEDSEGEEEEDDDCEVEEEEDNEEENEEDNSEGEEEEDNEDDNSEGEDKEDEIDEGENGNLGEKENDDDGVTKDELQKENEEVKEKPESEGTIQKKEI